MLFRDAVRSWVRLKDKDWSPSTKERVGGLIKVWEIVFGFLTLSELTTAQVEEYQAGRARGRKAATLNTERAYIGEFFAWCRRRKYMVEDVMEGWPVRKVVIDEEHWQVLEHDEEEAFFGQIEDETTRRVCLAALYTGMRRSLLRRLDWKYFQRGPGGWSVHVPAGIMKAKKPFHAPISEKAMAAMGEPKEEGLVFPCMPSDSTIWYQVGQASKAATGRHLHIHDLRRTFATRLLSKGAPMANVMRFGAWSSPKVLTEHYLARLNVEEARGDLKYLEE